MPKPLSVDKGLHIRRVYSSTGYVRQARELVLAESSFLSGLLPNFIWNHQPLKQLKLRQGSYFGQVDEGPCVGHGNRHGFKPHARSCATAFCCRSASSTQSMPIA